MFGDEKELTFSFILDDESRKNIDKLFGKFDIEITRKIIDVYNYMAENKMPKMYLKFEDGIKINISIDVSEYRGEVGEKE